MALFGVILFLGRPAVSQNLNELRKHDKHSRRDQVGGTGDHGAEGLCIGEAFDSALPPAEAAPPVQGVNFRLKKRSGWLLC